MERPILFSTEMVRAILDGRKTQTRRITKKQPVDILPMNVPDQWVVLLTREPAHGEVWKCRYGVPGDRLWVRETWIDPFTTEYIKPSKLPISTEIRYKAGESLNYSNWRPSIFMPRWASRITLEIVNVRVERVRDISEEDAWSEGVGGGQLSRFDIDGRILFKSTWNSINAKRGYGWDANPWVWVIEFKRIDNG